MIQRDVVCQYFPGEHRGWVICGRAETDFNTSPRDTNDESLVRYVRCYFPGCGDGDSGWCWIPEDELMPGQHVPGLLEQMDVRDDD